MRNTTTAKTTATERAQARLLAKLPATARQLTLAERQELKTLERAGTIAYRDEQWILVADSKLPETIEQLRAYDAACTRAREDSKNGYVQHVNRIVSGGGEVRYTVGDWYEGDMTVASFENGRAL